MHGLIQEVGQIGDASLMVMAGLLIADELSDANQELAQSEKFSEKTYVDKINLLSEKIAGLADTINVD